MTTTRCQAKDPSTCRVHGFNGVVRELTKRSEEALQERRTNDYLKIREQIDALNDNTTEQTIEARLAQWSTDKFDGSYTEDQIVQIMSYSMDDTERLKGERTLRARGYGDDDITIARHFDFAGYEDKGNDTEDFNEVSVWQIRQAVEDVEKRFSVTLSAGSVNKAAKDILVVDTLETRNSDTLDFHQIHRKSAYAFVDKLTTEARKLATKL